MAKPRVLDYRNLLDKALLSADLTSQEVKSWAKQMDAWQVELNDYGIDYDLSRHTKPLPGLGVFHHSRVFARNHH